MQSPILFNQWKMAGLEEIKEGIISALTEKFEDSDYFIVDVQVTPVGHINVFIDNEKNITIDECAGFSRFLENFLESNGLVGEKYRLEVSSPGMSEPFKVPRQYQKWIEKPVEVLLRTGIKEIGVLKTYDTDSLSVEIPEQKKKKEIIPAEIKTFALADIKYTRKHFVFK